MNATNRNRWTGLFFFNQNSKIMSLVPQDQDKITFFEELSTLMEDTAFKKFYTNYMDTPLEMKTTILYIELYQNIEKFYSQRTGKDIPKKCMTAVLKECMRRDTYRKPLVGVFNGFIKSEVTREQLNQSIENVFLANTKGLEFVNNLILQDGFQ